MDVLDGAIKGMSSRDHNSYFGRPFILPLTVLTRLGHNLSEKIKAGLRTERSRSAGKGPITGAGSIHCVYNVRPLDQDHSCDPHCGTTGPLSYDY